MASSQTQLSLPHRHHEMPSVYQVQHHPLVEGKKHVRNVYVGYMGTDKQSVKKSFEFEKTLKCPEGGAQGWDNQGMPLWSWNVAHCFTILLGLLRLEPGDYYFLRDPAVSTEPKDDVLAVMVTGR